MSRFLRACFVVICCTLVAFSSRGSAAADGPAVTVFAAASMTDVLEKLAADYRQHSPVVIRFSFAASSALARQIESGAPADIFISANEEWADYLAGKNLIDSATRVSPLGNTLVMITPADSPLTNVAIQPGFDIAGLIGKGNKLVTGDPANVPVGIYAKKALETLGVWAQADPLIARSDSVRAALALVERGEAPLGIVYGTDARSSSKVKVVGVFPPDSYPPIRYPFVIVTDRQTPAVQSFFAYITQASAAPVYESYGFTWTGSTQ